MIIFVVLISFEVEKWRKIEKNEDKTSIGRICLSHFCIIFLKFEKYNNIKFIKFAFLLFP